MQLYDANNKEIYSDISVFNPDEEPLIISQAVSQIRRVNDGQIIAYRHRNGDLYIMGYPSGDMIEEDIPN